MTALIWYCRNRRCRKPIRVQGDKPQDLVLCKCEVPQIGTPTRVTW